MGGTIVWCSAAKASCVAAAVGTQVLVELGTAAFTLWDEAQSIACAFVVGPVCSCLDVEFVVGVDFLDHSSANAHDLEHTRSCATEYDNCEHDHNENGCLQSGSVGSAQTCGKGDSDSPT